MIIAHDAGVEITLDGGKSWLMPPLPIAQFYHVACDTSVPYRVMGTMQDVGSASGPSNSLAAEGIVTSDWHPVGGGEAGHVAPDPSDPAVVYAGEYGGIVTRYDRRTRQARNVTAFPFDPSGIAPAELKYRFQWTAPIVVSRHDSQVVYHAANVVFRTQNGGQSWDKVSDDLTRNDKNKQKWSGGPDHRRQHRRRDLRDGLRPGRIAARQENPLGRQRRRPRPRLAGRRLHLEERHGQRARPARLGGGRVRRAVAVRRRGGLPRRR